jgi:hypothetical protein
VFGGQNPPAQTGITEEWVLTRSVGAWSTGGNMNTARAGSAGTSAGSQTACLVVSGYNGTALVTNNESYNGSSWTELADVNVARGSTAAGAGTTTSALFSGGDDGSPTVACESWNGSSWTEVGDLNTTRRGMCGFGADNTSALAFGGNPNPSSVIDNTESWNGSSWTEVNDLNTGRSSMCGAGIATAGLGWSGFSPGPPTDFTSGRVLNESWNGTSWTEVGDLNTSRTDATGSGTYTNALTYAGRNPSGRLTNTEDWDGVAWTETSDVSTARDDAANTQCGTIADSILCGGQTPSVTAATEEFSSTSTTTKVLTD